MSPYSIHSDIAKQLLLELELQEYEDFFDEDETTLTLLPYVDYDYYEAA